LLLKHYIEIHQSDIDRLTVVERAWLLIILKQIHEGSYEYMLDWLKNRDLTTVHFATLNPHIAPLLVAIARHEFGKLITLYEERYYSQESLAV